MDSEEKVHLKSERRGSSKFPNFIEHASKQKLSKLQIKKENKKLERLEEIRRKREAKAEREDVENAEISMQSKKAGPSSSSSSGGLLKRRQLFRDEFLDLHCEWKQCTVVESRMEDFMRHVAKHVTEAEVIHNPPPLSDSFACLWHECGFETINSSEMVRHINFHAFHSKVKCHGRNMLAINNMLPCKLDPGQRNVLPDLSEPFRCEWAECHLPDQSWDNAQTFYWHVKSHAEDLEGQLIQCGWLGCQRKDTSVSKLKEHIRCHSQERLVGCPTCGGLFANRVKFMDHCLKQQEGHTHVCPTCDKKFAIERHLRDHMRSHVNHYKCALCDMTCPTPSTLASHVKYRHTTEKPHSCEFCHYRGKTMADIKSHIRVHYSEVKVTCPEPGCDFSCRAKITLKQHHQTVHSDNAPKYACHVCDEKYFKGSDLTKHLVKAHSFSTPSGHSRFRYIKDSESGLYRLQTTRFESFDMLQSVSNMSTPALPVKPKRGRKQNPMVKTEPMSLLQDENVPPPIVEASGIVGVPVEASEMMVDLAEVMVKIEDDSISVPVVEAGGQDSNDVVTAAMMAALEQDEVDPGVVVSEVVPCNSNDDLLDTAALDSFIVIPVLDTDIAEADLVAVEDEAIIDTVDVQPQIMDNIEVQEVISSVAVIDAKNEGVVHIEVISETNSTMLVGDEGVIDQEQVNPLDGKSNI